MLPAHLVDNNGLKVIEEYPDMRTNIRRSVGDLDVSAAYPNNGVCFNISKRTTMAEIIDIEGVDEFTRRMQGLNTLGGATNAVEVCTNLFSMPTMFQMLSAFRQHLGRPPTVF
jgi:hypothetical protein